MLKPSLRTKTGANKHIAKKNLQYTDSGKKVLRRFSQQIETIKKYATMVSINHYHNCISLYHGLAMDTVPLANRCLQEIIVTFFVSDSDSHGGNSLKLKKFLLENGVR